MFQVAILHLSSPFSEVLGESCSKFLNFNIPAALLEQGPPLFLPSSGYSKNSEFFRGTSCIPDWWCLFQSLRWFGHAKRGTTHSTWAKHVLLADSHWWCAFCAHKWHAAVCRSLCMDCVESKALFIDFWLPTMIPGQSVFAEFFTCQIGNFCPARLLAPGIYILFCAISALLLFQDRCHWFLFI